MTILTSYWNKVARTDVSDYLIVQVSDSRPKWFDKGPVLELRTVYPAWRLVEDYKRGNITSEVYTEAYARQISEEDISIAREQLEEALKHMGKEKALFVCWEGTGKFCHRYACAHMIAGTDCAEL